VRPRQLNSRADRPGAGALITVDGIATHLRCSPGPDSAIIYNALAFTSPALDPAVEHTVTVSIDPDSTPTEGQHALDLDRFVIVRPDPQDSQLTQISGKRSSRRSRRRPRRPAPAPLPSRPLRPRL